MCATLLTRRAPFLSTGDNDTGKAGAAERSRLAVDPLPVGNGYLVGARDCRVKFAHREYGLIAISSSDDYIFAVKITLNGGTDLDPLQNSANPRAEYR